MAGCGCGGGGQARCALPLHLAAEGADQDAAGADLASWVRAGGLEGRLGAGKVRVKGAVGGLKG